MKPAIFSRVACDALTHTATRPTTVAVSCLLSRDCIPRTESLAVRPRLHPSTHSIRGRPRLADRHSTIVPTLLIWSSLDFSGARQSCGYLGDATRSPHEHVPAKLRARGCDSRFRHTPP